MADIIYTYNGRAYANITNKCNCRCSFCIRFQTDGIGNAETLWHETDPTFDEIKAAIDAYDFTGQDELIYCGYGEPTCALDNLLRSAEYAKKKYGLAVRVNTNGLGNLENGEDIVPRLKGIVDRCSVSLNAPDCDAYERVSHPKPDGAYEAMKAFAAECRSAGIDVKFSVVDVIPPEEINACREIAHAMGIPLRIRHFSS